jgi:hypothetical protein
MLTYSRAGGTFVGNIGGKALHFTARPAQSGAQPPPGNYQIHRPMNDPIYGMVALMTPVGIQAGNAGKFVPGRDYTAPAFTYSAPAGAGYDPGFKVVFAPGYLQVVAPGRDYTAPAAIASAIFVLSSRPILGQNSLVIMVGFADLMDALTAEGGATVRVG